jgi:nucleoside-diphosphate-sugar epimerase
MNSGAPGRFFCFGLGYTAGFLARELAAAGWEVAGTNREGEARGDLANIKLYPFTRGAPLSEPGVFHRATHILISVPPDEVGDPVLAEHERHLAALSTLQWLGYLSTTGVYGDRGGGWVDEDSALAPIGERGRRRVAAEKQWLDLRHRYGLPVHVFRLAGIYGPGRNALDTVRQGRAKRIDRPGQVFSRIHVADIVQVLRASLRQPAPGAVYNVCDDDPAPPEAVIAYACELLGVPPPRLVPLDQAALSSMARSFYDDNKRVSNRHIKESLGVCLRYPSYRDGLLTLLHA